MCGACASTDNGRVRRAHTPAMAYDSLSSEEKQAFRVYLGSLEAHRDATKEYIDGTRKGVTRDGRLAAMRDMLTTIASHIDRIEETGERQAAKRQKREALSAKVVKFIDDVRVKGEAVRRCIDDNAFVSSTQGLADIAKELHAVRKAVDEMVDV